MSIFDRHDFDELLAGIIYDSRVQSPDCDIATHESADVSSYGDDWDDDEGQPTHYEEMQDVYGGDDYVEQWEVE